VHLFEGGHDFLKRCAAEICSRAQNCLAAAAQVSERASERLPL
jgi:surfactin synthase thioesterase subunit